jgi:hypothetical protein
MSTPTTDVEEAKTVKRPISNDIRYFWGKITQAYLVAKLAKDYICFQNRFRICDGKLYVEQVKY